ncbi:hypothetical protein GF312_11390 [Candidatus Poribacteria bacterium]|nr:hypothetical protein [Candidatus Poribacteria bacterium]
MRIAVIGLAGVGRIHVEKVNSMKETELTSVCDIIPEIAIKTGEKFGVKAYKSAEEMLDKGKPEGVILATPPKSHYPITKMSAERGIHVLAEKPMASNVEDCQRMIQVCKENGVTLMVGHKKRFVPVLVRMKKLIDGEFGQIQYMIHRYPHPWLSDKDWFWREDDGGGPILENAVHATDILGFLMGDIERVSAEGGTFFAPHRKPQIDCAVYTLKFRSGAIATVGAGMVSMPAFNFEDFYMANENGVAEISGQFDSVENLRYSFRSKPDEINEEKYPDADAFANEIRHFMECSETGKKPVASGEAGMKAVAICRAVKKSAESGKPVYIQNN